MLHESLGQLGQTTLVLLSLFFGGIFGLVAYLLIETMRAVERV